MVQNRRYPLSQLVEEKTLLTFEIESEDGKTYSVQPWQPDVQTVLDTWEKFSKYRIIFSDVQVDDPQKFLAMMMNPGSVVLEISCEGKEVGMYYLTGISPLTSAYVHYAFWDRKSSGRQRLVLTIARRVMDELDLHRVTISVPIYAYAALNRIQRMGLRIEGRRREAILHQGRWADKLEFGTLREELTDEALEAGRIPREEHEENWYGLLKDDEKLYEKVLRPRRSDGVRG